MGIFSLHVLCVMQRSLAHNSRNLITKLRPTHVCSPVCLRELQNRVKRSVLVSESPVLEMEGLDTEIHQHDNESTATPAIRPLKDEAQEKMNIINALNACNGHREQAAAILKINPATLYRKT